MREQRNIRGKKALRIGNSETTNTPSQKPQTYTANRDDVADIEDMISVYRPSDLWHPQYFRISSTALLSIVLSPFYSLDTNTLLVALYHTRSEHCGITQETITRIVLYVTITSRHRFVKGIQVVFLLKRIEPSSPTFNTIHQGMRLSWAADIWSKNLCFIC